MMNRRTFLALAGAAAIAPALAKAKPFGDYRDYVATGRTGVRARIGEFSITASVDFSSSGPMLGSNVYLLRNGMPDLCLGRIEAIDVSGTTVTLSGPMPCV